jgi:hypothetical protein
MMTTSLEREYQIRLDKIARVNEETFVCDSCEIELALEQQCDHDPTVHNWCIDCCENSEEHSSPMQWDDLD